MLAPLLLQSIDVRTNPLRAFLYDLELLSATVDTRLLRSAGLLGGSLALIFLAMLLQLSP
jgi:hypothetical protein